MNKKISVSEMERKGIGETDMVIIIHILTILLAVATFFIIKNKRYKVVPLVSWVIFIFFIGCGIISAVSLLVPYGEIFVLPLGGIVLGLVVILAAFNDFYSLIRCKEKIEGIYRGYNTYYGGNGISTQAPVFEYMYNGTWYQGLFDKFFKRNVPVKEKVFEDYFTEVQADMVSICLEYVENKADKIYIYASFEANVMTPDYFYDIGGIVLNKHKLNDAKNGFVYDVSFDRQKACLHILMEDIKKMVNLCKEYNRPMPTEIKMVYEVNTKELHADYKYESVYSNHKTKTAYHVVKEWMEEVKNQKSENKSCFFPDSYI